MEFSWLAIDGGINNWNWASSPVGRYKKVEPRTGLYKKTTRKTWESTYLFNKHLLNNLVLDPLLMVIVYPTWFTKDLRVDPLIGLFQLMLISYSTLRRDKKTCYATLFLTLLSKLLRFLIWSEFSWCTSSCNAAAVMSNLCDTSVELQITSV